MNAPAKLSELIEALEFDSDECVTRFDREAGRMVRVAQSVLSVVEEGQEEELELPE